MDDNLYPNDGQYFRPTEPKQQEVDRDQEIADTLASIPLLKEVVDNIDKRISFYESTSSYPEEVLGNTELFMHTVAGNKITVANLIIERDFILGRVANVKP